MRNNWERLVVSLSEVVDIYIAILQLSRQKQEVLVSVRPQELEVITKQEEFLILQAGKIEKTRGELIKKLAATYNLDERELTFTKLVEIAEPDVGERLKAIAAELDQIMRDLAPVNQVNAEMIQRALGFINYSINILSHSSAGPTYAPQGQGGQAPQVRKLVDRKV